MLVGGVSGRGVVAGASYEARQHGARSAMPTARAMRMIGPRVVVVHPRKEVYAAASAKVFDIIRSRVDLVEQISIDEAYLEPAELAGASPEEVKTWANELRAHIKEVTGLASSIGAGNGKQYAKIGSDEAKPNGTFIIPPDQTVEIIHPMPVKNLWGVGPVTERKLADMNVHTIGDLAALSQREVEISLGSVVGISLWNLARGHDNRPLETHVEAKQTSAEHTYPRDLTTREEVDAAVRRAAQDAHRRLLNDGRGARTITVKLRMADFRIESRSATLPYSTDDLETLTAVAFRVVRYPQEVGPIRLVGVSYSGLEQQRQDVLFPELDRVIVRKPVAVNDDFETGVSDRLEEAEPTTFEELSETTSGWKPTQDVFHPEYGHGWIQGTGHGVLTVRFETRATGPGKTKTFLVDDPNLEPADPLASLAWDMQE